MHSLTRGVDGHMDADLSARVRREISRIRRGVPAGSSCVLTGSIVEGLGNQNSDIDLFAVLPEGARRRGTAIGIRPGSYVDCEYFTVDALAAVKDAVEAPGWPGALDCALGSINAYYRFAIAVPEHVDPAHQELLTSFSVDVTTQQFARRAAIEAVRSSACAEFALAANDQRCALLHQREGALWHASSILAQHHAEGYPGLKWTVEKAARALGADSVAFRSLLAPYTDTAASLDERVHALAASLTAPDTVRERLSAYDISLTAETRLVRSNRATFAITSGPAVCMPDGIDTRLLDGLLDGKANAWDDTVAAYASELGCEPTIVRIALHRRVVQLEAAGLVAMEDTHE